MSSEKSVMRKYNFILRDMIKKIGHDGSTTTSELNGWGKHLFGKKFVGVFPSNHFPQQLSKSRPYCILNTKPSSDSGEHWVACIYKDKKEVLIYDSYGRETDDIMNLKYTGKETIESDRDAEQKQEEESCGQRSLSYLLFYDIYGIKASMMI